MKKNGMIIFNKKEINKLVLKKRNNYYILQKEFLKKQIKRIDKKITLKLH